MTIVKYMGNGTQEAARNNKNRGREGRLSMSEIVIVILYHIKKFKNFKCYYKHVVEIKCKSCLRKRHPTKDSYR